MFFGCSDCRNKFDTLQSFNQHIAKSGHEKSHKVTPIEVLEMISKKINFLGMSLNITSFKKAVLPKNSFYD